ncbi:MAG: VOC family protein [Gammaproteobacteria bacterium]|nr:VOC family protein [Gammaproteobacteria bacterium]
MPTRDQRADIIPSLRYHDAPAALDWLCAAFGFERRFVVPDAEGGIAHARLTFGNAMVMLATARDDEFGPVQMLVRVADVDTHHARAAAAGAQVVLEPHDFAFGGRLYACRDPEGNLWNFGTHDPWEDEQPAA